MVDYELIGKVIKARHAQRKLTQSMLAEKCDITIEYLSKIENGRVKPTIETLSIICEKMQFDMSELFSGVVVDLNNYNNEEILRYFQSCRPEVKPVALDLMKKLSEL